MVIQAGKCVTILREIICSMCPSIHLPRSRLQFGTLRTTFNAWAANSMNSGESIVQMIFVSKSLQRQKAFFDFNDPILNATIFLNEAANELTMRCCTQVAQAPG